MKKLQITTLILTLLTLTLGVIEKLVFNAIGNMFYIITPILVIITFILGLFAFKNNLVFSSKWFLFFIAVIFIEALTSIGSIPILIAKKYTAINIVFALFKALAYLFLLVGCFCKNAHKKLYLSGFTLLILNLILEIFITHSFTTAFILQLLMYIFFGCILCGLFPSTFNRILRFFIVLFSFLLIKTIGIYMMIAYIIFSFLLLPGFNKITFSVTKIVALLCSLSAILSLSGHNTYKLSFNLAKEVRNDIAETEKIIEESVNEYGTVEINRSEIEKNKTKISDSKEELETAEQRVLEANDNLDTVCDRSYYSVYFDCDETCKPFHDALDDAEKEVYTLESEISDLELDIQKREATILSITSFEEYLNAQKQSHMQTMICGIINVIGNLLSVVALIGFAVYLLKNSFIRIARISFIMFIFGQLILLLGYIFDPYLFWTFDIFGYPIYKLIFNSYFWSIISVSLLAGICLDKFKNPAKIRILVIISSVVMLICSKFASPAIWCLTITTVGAVFVFAPFKFTEYINIAKHVFLSVFTLGIWNLIWVYNITKNLNSAQTGEKRQPVKELLLYTFLPFYSLYWTFRTAELVEDYAEIKDMKFKISLYCLAFMFICPLVSSILIQDKINKIVCLSKLGI